MFSNILAWTAFIGGFIIFAVIILDMIVNRHANKLEEIMYGKRTYMNAKTAFIFLVWAAGGIYLFG